MFGDDTVMLGREGNEAKLTPRSLQMRMDRAIRRSVIAALEKDVRFPEGTVWVGVKNGWVTLRGQVDWDSERALATVLTRDQVGVRGVTNGITVAAIWRPAPTRQPD
jgi:osmotically-inducible protein OsmY